MTIDRWADAPASTHRDDIGLLERQLMALIDSYRQKYRERAAEFDEALQPAGYRTLMELVFLGPTSPTHLADTLGFDKSVLSRQLNQLEELGHVNRSQNPDDRRAVIISATPAAVTRIQALSEGHRDAFRARLATWNPEDVKELSRLLNELSRT
jgi:DNA-binding MarR family transcriptional regulator